MNSKTFCIYPWDHLATLTNGSIIPCCVAEDDRSLNLAKDTFQSAWNSSTFKNIRKKMMNGETVQACDRCFKEEKSGIRSHRIQSNEHYQNILGSFDDLIKNTDSEGNYNGPIRSLDLRLGNNCNLKCVMCRPNESSKWFSDAEAFYKSVKNSHLKAEMKDKMNVNQSHFEWSQSESFWNQLQILAPQLREIIMAGGEPFIIKEQHRFLNECVKNGLAKNLKIRYHTNGTIIDKELFKAFEEFKQIEVMVSLDGVDEQNYYMRFPAKWASIEENLRLLDETTANVKIYLLSSMHVMSLYYFPDFIRWICNKKFKKVAQDKSYQMLACTGIVHHPDYLNVQILPIEVKNKIKNRFEQLYSELDSEFFKNQIDLSNAFKARINANLDYMFANDQSRLLPSFFEFIQHLDSARGTSFKKTFPELAQDLNL